MNRTAIYSQDKSRRVISVPGGLWQLQEYDSKGAAPSNVLDKRCKGSCCHFS